LRRAPLPPHSRTLPRAPHIADSISFSEKAQSLRMK